MQARRLPAIRGWNWIVEGFRLFRANPAAATFMVFSSFLFWMALSLFPFVGLVAGVVVFPSILMSILTGFREIDENRGVGFAIVFAGFRTNLPSLLALGGLLFLGIFLALAAAGYADPELMEVFEGNRKLDLEAIKAIQLPLLVLGIVTTVFCFSPLLVAWGGLGVAKALFFSFVGVARNWRAMLIYMIATNLITTILPAVLLEVAGLVSPTLPQVLGVAVTMLLLFIFVPTLFASFYVSYRDVFVRPSETAHA